MGFYYFMLLFFGIGLTFVGGIRFICTRKHGVIAFCGIAMIALSIILFQPGSSDMIAGLLGIG